MDSAGMAFSFRVLTEGVPTADERHGLGVVHAHPPEDLADLRGAQRRVGYPHRALGVH